jgi:hypothetical protein
MTGYKIFHNKVYAQILTKKLQELGAYVYVEKFWDRIAGELPRRFYIIRYIISEDNAK